MNLENQLQVAFATNAELREQIDSLTRVNWSLEERLRHDAESREEMRTFYENQMENLRKEQRVALAKLQEQHWWQIESFFKWIKGNLTIKSLWGYSENAVKIHLWVAISSYLMLAWVKAELKSPLTITEISKVIEASILSKADIKELLDVPEPLTQNQNVNELLLF